MFDIVTQPYYQAGSIIIDAFSMMLLLVIAVTMVGLPKQSATRKLRRTFAWCLGIGLASCALDIWSYALFKNPAMLKMYAIVTEADAVAAVLFGMSCAGVVVRFLLLNGKANIILRETIRGLYIICVVANAIPPVFTKIYAFTETGEMENNVLAVPYFCCLILANLLLLVLILLNRKALGVKFSILALVLRTLPFVVFILVQDNEPTLMFSYALFLLVSYIFVFQRTYKELGEKEKKMYEQKMMLADLRTKVMLSQVRPHFVYNTLSSVALLCGKDPKRAKQLTLDFSDYLRNHLDTLNSQENAVCSFEEELAHIQCYLNIELVRFEDRLRVVYDIGVSDFSVPPLSIQPIVENAVKHGVSERVEGGTVTITSLETALAYVIKVTDDGVGFDTNHQPTDGKEHIGIPNIEKRIALFGGTFRIESTPGVGTQATVFLPKTEMRK